MKRLRVVAGVAVSVALFVYLFRSVDLPELGHQLALTSWAWVVPAVAVAPLGLWARARRWRYLFPPGQEPPGLVAANMIGYMGNNVLPLRAGEFVRIYVVARRIAAQRGGSVSNGLWLAGATVVIERVLDSLTLVLILGVLVLLIPGSPRAGVRRGRRARHRRGRGLRAGHAGTRAGFFPPAGGPAHATPAGTPAPRRTRAGADPAWTRGHSRAGPPAAAARLDRGGLGLSATGAWTLLRAMHLDLPFVAGWTVMTFVGFGISIPSAPGYVGVWHAAAVPGALDLRRRPGDGLGYALALPCQSVRTDHADRLAVPRCAST